LINTVNKPPGAKEQAMRIVKLSLDELLELIELENLPDAPQDEVIYFAYLNNKLNTILTYADI